MVSGKEEKNLRVEKLLCNIVRIIAFLFIAYLFIVSLFSTVFVSEYERVFYIKDGIAKNVFVIILSVLVCYFVTRKYGKWISKNIEKIAHIVSFLFPAILLLLVLTTQYSPKFDQAQILKVANNMCNQDYSDFLQGGYADRCDNQWGIILAYYFIFKLFGANNYLLIQIINVISIASLLYFIKKILGYILGKNKAAFVYICMSLFLPLWSYSTFLYGNYPAMAMAFGAISIAMPYICSKTGADLNIETNQKESDQDAFALKGQLLGKKHLANKGILDIISFSLLIGIAFQLKLYVIIPFIAFAIIFIFSSISRRTIRPVLFVAVAFILMVLMGKGVNAYIGSLTGLPHNGLPRSAQIAMGFQQSDRPDGWYNGYIEEVYEENGYDHDATNAAALASINESLAGFKANPKNALGFFDRKLVSQWNDPTFESFHILVNRFSQLNSNAIISRILNNGKGSSIILEIMNIIHLLVLFGVLLYLCFVNDSRLIQLFPMIIFLGGLFFHLIWEASSQYTLIYFMMLIPYACLGFIKISSFGLLVENASKTKKSENIMQDDERELGLNSAIKKVSVFTIAIVLAIIFIAILPDGTLGRFFKPTWMEEEYQAYKNEFSGKPFLSDGKYVISPFNEENLVLAVADNSKEAGSKIILANKDQVTDKIITLWDDSEYSGFSSNSAKKYNGSQVIRIHSSQMVLDIENGVVEKGSRIQQWTYNGDLGQHFEIKVQDDGSYAIFCGEYAVSYDEDGLLLDSWSAGKNQKWIIAKNRIID